MNYTYQNHLKYYIGKKKFGERKNSFEKFRVKVGQIDKQHYKKSNYRDELKRSADLIYSEYKNDLVLFLSGGTDSEIVARTFLDIGIKIPCYTIKFKNDYNIFDVNDAISLSNELDLKLNIIEFDIKDFFYSKCAEEFSKQISCSQIAYLTVYYCIKNLSLPSIMGGELLLKRNVNVDPSSWYYCFRENEDASAIRFSKKYRIPLVNEFFSYTPELMLYYLELPEIKNLVTNKFNYKLTSVSSKNEILKKLIPEINVRKKTHGFEKLLGFNFEVYRKLMNQQVLRLENSLDGIEYHECIRMLKNENN